MDRIKVGIIGPGAVGRMMAAYCQWKGICCHSFGRHGPVSFKQSIIMDDHHFHLEQNLGDLALVDLVFVTVKAYQIRDVLSQYGEDIKNKSVIFAANGWFDDCFSRYDLDELDWQFGYSSIGASFVGQTLVIHNHGGHVFWQKLRHENAKIEKVESLLAEFGFASKEDLSALRKKKWLFNTVLNTICGAHKLSSNGLLLKDLSFLRKVFLEAYLLGEMKIGPWMQNQQDLWSEMIRLIESTRNNQNSMYVDVIKNRQTENQYLAGLCLNDESKKEHFPNLWPLAQKIEAFDEQTHHQKPE